MPFGSSRIAKPIALTGMIRRILILILLTTSCNIVYSQDLDLHSFFRNQNKSSSQNYLNKIDSLERRSTTSDSNFVKLYNQLDSSSTSLINLLDDTVLKILILLDEDTQDIIDTLNNGFAVYYSRRIKAKDNFTVPMKVLNEYKIGDRSCLNLLASSSTDYNSKLKQITTEFCNEMQSINESNYLIEEKEFEAFFDHIPVVALIAIIDSMKQKVIVNKYEVLTCLNSN